MRLDISQGYMFGMELPAWAAYMVAASVFHSYAATCRMTNSVEGEHSDKSLHYVGLAVDIGLGGIDVRIHQELADKIRAKLSPEYDVVLEPYHIHIEFQPKTKTKVTK